MEQEKGSQTAATFFTEPRSRPRTSHISRNKTQLRQQFALDPEIDPSAKLKSVKEQLKHLQGEYVSMVSRLNDSKKVIDKQNRHSQKRKVQFLNLYQHRKLKLYEQKLLDQKQEQELKHKQGLKEKTKTMKLNSQIRALLLRNELEQNNSQACSKNKLSKQKHKQELLRQREKELALARGSFCRIKAGEQELHSKRRRISEMQATMAKSNYIRKLGEEVGAVERLDKMLNEICSQQFCEDCIGDSPVFITEKAP